MRRVVATLRDAINAVLRGERAAGDIADEVSAFLEVAEEEIFEHFDREEQALFPFLRTVMSDMEASIARLERGHDTMCGVITRISRIAGSENALTENFETLVALFARFDANFVSHSEAEWSIIRRIAEQLNADERRRLGELLSEI